MPKLVVAVLNFANAPSKEYVVSLCALHCLFQDRRGRYNFTYTTSALQPINIHPALVLRLFLLTPLANLYHFLICAVSYSV